MKTITVIICGKPGIGKTTLGRGLKTLLEENPNLMKYVDEVKCYGFNGKSSFPIEYFEHEFTVTKD